MPAWISLRWHHPTLRRYYEVRLQPDLWQEWCLTKAWGSLASAQGVVKHIHCASYQEGLAHLDTIAKTRERRGYRLLPSPASPQLS